MENCLKSPNLPAGEVSLCLLDARAGDSIVESLKDMGIGIIRCQRCDELYDAVSCHPDMLFHHLGGNDIVAALNASQETLEELKRHKFHIIKGRYPVSDKYPYCAAYNVARIGDYAICNKKIIDPVLLDCLTSLGIRILDVKQGYCKCSLCIVNANAIITSDEGIYKSLSKYDFDILKINPGSIRLSGLNYGFIGGASGLIDKNTLAFAGKIENHPDCDSMLEFLSKYDVQTKDLGNGALTDIGSLIPLKERLC
jgi:hypothetical protein